MPVRWVTSSLCLQEYYDESICLLKFQLGVFHASECQCEEGSSDDHVQHVRSTNVLEGKRSYEEVRTLDPQLVEPLVKVDLQLYAFALDLFRQRVRQAEEELGLRFLCT